MKKCYLLDVGHGNCAIFTSDKSTMVIDAPKGTTLPDTLEKLEITEIDAIFVSHSDADHVTGISTLLLNKKFKVKTVFVNADGQKDTEAWKQFRTAVAASKDVEFRSINTTSPKSYGIGDIKVVVCSPLPENAVVGPGGKTLSGQTITANSSSVVVKVNYQDQPRLLLAADMELGNLNDMIAQGYDLRAPVLVFPHHGGLPSGTDPVKFTELLLTQVQPELAVISNGRLGAYKNPRKEIVNTVTNNGCRVACTQMSEACAGDCSMHSRHHLSDMPAKGLETNSTCAGTIVFDMEKFDLSSLEAHKAFVDGEVPSRLCAAEQKDKEQAAA